MISIYLGPKYFSPIKISRNDLRAVAFDKDCSIETKDTNIISFDQQNLINSNSKMLLIASKVRAYWTGHTFDLITFNASTSSDVELEYSTFLEELGKWSEVQ